jgi:hypothetical protein
MKVYVNTRIDWLKSMERLSIGAFYLLNVLYRYDIDVNDESIRIKTGVGMSTHRKYKKELIDTGYLQIEQIGKASYKYSLQEID